MTSSAPASAELTIVVPVFRERDNLSALVAEVQSTLQGVRWEIIFVDDDSPDGTAERARQIAAENPQVRCLQRIGRRGLSTACIEGMLASSAPYVAVMDGDLQHDPAILPRMLECLRATDTDLVVGSRHVEGGGLGDWDRKRARVSQLATWMGRSVIPATLRDPMSGYFMLKRTTLELVVRQLSGLGFKILLDIFASAPRPLVFREIPYVFRNRVAGESKLDGQVVWEYMMLLADKLIGRYVPVRFVSFITIGALGLLVHLAVLRLWMAISDDTFVVGHSIATMAAIVFNYSCNNALTYRDRRRRGWEWVSGLASFTLVCAIGAIANIGIANYLFERHSTWVLAAVAGVLAGAVWNYAVTSVYTWGRKS